MKAEIKTLAQEIWSALMPTSRAAANGAAQNEQQQINPPPVAVTVRIDPPVTKSLAELTEEKWREEGGKQARQSKATKPDAAVEKALAERADAATRAAMPPGYDPARHQIDRRTEARLARRDSEVVEIEENLNVSAGHVRLREEERAKVGDEGVLPTASDLLRGVTTAALILSFAPTIHDFLGSMFGPLKWMLAVGFGGAIALFIVCAILPDNDSLRGEERGFGAAAAGAAVGAGFLLVRFAGAHGFSDYVFGLGMAFVEVGAVVFLECKARAICAERTCWLGRREAREKADALLTAAKNEHRRQEERLDAIKVEIGAIEGEYLVSRVFTSVDALAALAAASAVDGYRAGVRLNRTNQIAPGEGA